MYRHRNCDANFIRGKEGTEQPFSFMQWGTAIRKKNNCDLDFMQMAKNNRQKITNVSPSPIAFLLPLIAIFREPQRQEVDGVKGKMAVAGRRSSQISALLSDEGTAVGRRRSQNLERSAYHAAPPHTHTQQIYTTK